MLGKAEEGALQLAGALGPCPLGWAQSSCIGPEPDFWWGEGEKRVEGPGEST